MIKITLHRFQLIIVALFSCYSLQAQNQKPVEREWTSFVQSIDISTSKKVKFKLSASAKVVSNNTSAKSGLWARVDNKKRKTGFFDNMSNRPIRNSEWETFSIEGEFDKRAERLVFGGLMYNDGEFYFDNFKLQIENENGILEDVTISNASFENLNENNSPTGWNLGISKGENTQIKGFSLKPTTEATNGNTSLLIIGNNISPNKDYIIDIEDGYSPQIGTLVSMLNSLKKRVEQTVGNLSIYETDYLMDENSNRIGSLIYHLAATEKVYQIATFERRDLTPEEEKIWGPAMELDDSGRDEFQGKTIRYYLDIYDEVRATTLEEFKKRDDDWLLKKEDGYETNNYWSWFHVMEHQSSHLGQILLMKKRIKPEEEPENSIGKKDEIKG